ncbi:MAG: LytTR family transcriptional regulator [Oscillospiraceae bacterium]|nr:LytTR family transcriptional regulator [Oscillospiraceae bacterium]
MKIRIEIDETVQEDEVIVKCRELNDNVRRIQQAVSEISDRNEIEFFKDGAEYFLPVESVLFFETAGSLIDAHTADDVFQVKAKLYELENILPGYFVRVSKSTILNIRHIYSIEKNITSSSLVRFSKTHKQVYVSRNYYKFLKQRLSERSI